MKMQKMYNWEKNAKALFGGILSASLLLFGVASCNSGGGERVETEEGEVARTEEPGYGSEALGTENELAGNNVAGDFDRWDVNQDERFDETEFGTVARDAGFFKKWDTDQDGALAENELNEGVYGVYDEDNDGLFSNEEFNSWNTGWGGNYDYNEWDANGDNMIDSDEYNAGLGNAGVYNEWDSDRNGIYEEDEVYRGLYGTADRDQDGNLASEEYEQIGYNLWGF